MSLDFRKRIMDKVESLGRSITLTDIEEINCNVINKVKSGYCKIDVMEHYLQDVLRKN